MAHLDITHYQSLTKENERDIENAANKSNFTLLYGKTALRKEITIEDYKIRKGNICVAILTF